MPGVGSLSRACRKFHESVLLSLCSIAPFLSTCSEKLQGAEAVVEISSRHDVFAEG